MRLPMFATEPVDADFVAAAPFRLRDTFAIPRSAGEVWAALTADAVLSWCRIIQDVTWTSPQPYGVGTTRRVRAFGGANVINEHFFRWEEGRRQSFYAIETTAPMFRRFAEDYELEPAGEGACRLIWTIAIEPRPWARATAPVNRRIFTTLFTDTRLHFGAG